MTSFPVESPGSDDAQTHLQAKEIIINLIWDYLFVFN